MEVRLTKDFRGKETGEVFYLSGSVVAMRDDHAQRLLDLGFAVPYDGWEGGNVNPLPPPPVDPTLETKQMTVGKAAALVARDNDAIIVALREIVEREAEPETVENHFYGTVTLEEGVIDRILEAAKAPEPEPEPKPKRGRKAKK
jgi:hypothetical protein